MIRILALCLCLLLSSAAAGLAGEVNQDGGSDAREMSGMSIVGNDEAPKSLYIVPWKSSDVGTETRLDPMLTEDDVPVDREVFRRRIEFYRISTGQ